LRKEERIIGRSLENEEKKFKKGANLGAPLEVTFKEREGPRGDI